MELIRTIRGRRGLSQRALAQRAGLSFRGVQTDRVAEARRPSIEPGTRRQGPWTAGERHQARGVPCVAGAARLAVLRVRPDDRGRGRVVARPPDGRRRRGAALPVGCRVGDAAGGRVAGAASRPAGGVAETLAAECGAGPPDWTNGVGPLDRPWFVSSYENLKASALVESPVPFRSRNVFVLANFLDRV